jgi:F0F1-type ATP synthase assembly protein I
LKNSGNEGYKHNSMEQRLLLLFNTLTLLGTLLINYLGGTGNLNGPSIGEVSDRYPTLITPAGYAFSIWGLIYFLLLAFVAYQWHAYFHDRNQESIHKAGIWFSLANIANGLWVIAWTNEALGFSVMLIFLLLFFLVLLVLRLRLEIWDAPLRMIAFVWWPVCIYIGWIILAVVINVAVYLKKIAVLKGILPAETWAMITILVAGFVYGFLTYSRNMREAALVGVWGLVAIAYEQWPSHGSVVATALIVAGILLVYAVYHALKNKETSPLKKLKDAVQMND